MKDRLLDKIIRFDVLLGFVALIIAFVAAFFSVYGIATLFAGAFVSTVVMASALEIGKLVSVTYLYRYWKQTKAWLALYLSLALVILMIITSGGIFGYLSAAYQKSSTAYKAQQDQIVLIEKTKTYAQNKIDQAQLRIVALNELRKTQESRMSEAMTNSFISRNVISLKQIQDQTAEMIKQTETDVKAEQIKIDDSIKEIADIDKKVSEMRYGENNKDIRTFEFVAKLFGTDLDTVAKWFIFLLIVVFDPLAVALILAYNVITYKKSEPVKAEPEVVQPPEPEVKKKVGKPRPIRFPFQRIPKLEPVVVPQPEPEPEPPVAPTVPPTPPLPSGFDDFGKGYFKSY